MSAAAAGTLRTAFVSGASSGLGEAFSLMLMGEGARVWGTSRSLQRLAALAAAHPGAFEPVALDLAEPGAAAAAFGGALAAAGGFDVVVNNAGFGVFGDFAATDAAVWTGQITAMLGSVTAISHAAFRSMLERRSGCLVHVSSLAAEFPLPYMSGYNVAKAGLSALSESLIFESRGTGVRVVDFRPGDYRTEFNRSMRNEFSSERVRRAWEALDRMFNAAPEPRKAAGDLRRAILSGRSGIVRSGTLFQARIAPALARVAPAGLMRAALARYYGV